MRVISLSDDSRSFNNSLDIALDYLKQGEIIIAPTETAYGLITDAQNKKSVRKLFELKNRSLEKPTAIIIKSAAELENYIEKEELNKIEGIKKLFPGPVTFILKSNITTWDGILSTSGKIGFRCSSHPFIKALTTKINRPLTATSANLSGKTVESINDLINTFSEKVKLFILDDNLQFDNLPSTVVEFEGNRIIIHRTGAISEDLIRKRFEYVK